MADKTEEDYVAIDELVCENAQNFSDIFYQAMDKRREHVHKMYTDAACFVWNGHSLTGRANIHIFLTDLPETSHHVVSVDAQHVDEKYTGGTKSMMVTCAGTVSLGSRDEIQNDDRGAGATHGFTQTFMLAKDQSGKYKIAMDRFRFAD